VNVNLYNLGLTIADKAPPRFWKLFEQLPVRIQTAARGAFAQFQENPDHRSLNRKHLNDKASSRHRDGSISVRVTKMYRAIYIVEGDDNVWYWIGSHEDYNNFTGQK